MGERSGYLYWNGKRLEAEDDYRTYRVKDKYYLVNASGKIQKSSSKNMISKNMAMIFT